MDARHVGDSADRPATSRRDALRGLAAGAVLAAAGWAPTEAANATPVAPAESWDEVEAIARDAEGTDGTIGVAVHGAAGPIYSRHGARRFRAASTIKVPIVIEAFRQVERGALSFDDRQVLHDEDRVPGSGVLSHLHAGLVVTLADLLSLTVSVSDNTATNLILDRTGLDAVNETMQSLGMRDSVLGRRILGRLPNPGDPDNWATPDDFARAVHAVVAGDAASPESCARIMELLTQQGEIRRISRFLSPAPGLSWGTKPGDLPGVINDVGFVATDAGTLSIAVFCEDLPDLDVAERAIGLISRTALALTGIVPLADAATGSQ